MGTFVENVNQLATDLTQDLIDDIVTVAPIAGDISTAAASSAEIVITADNITNVNAVGADLLEPVSEINTVATNMPDINTVATDIANVNINAANIADINAIADQVVPNIAEILQADNNAATVIALLDEFDDRYLGAKAVEPTLDNDGNALIDGALYWNSTTKQMMVWDLSNTMWVPAATLSATSTAILTNKTLDSITNTVGADHVHYKVRNESGSTIDIGTVLTASGTQPGTDYIQVMPITDPQTQVAIGIAHTTLANNGTGLALNTGIKDDVDTSAWALGTILYPNTSGGFTTVRPTSGRYQACAYVMRQHATQGTLLCEFTEPQTIYVGQDSTTGAAYIPSGTTAQRPVTPTTGYMRFNTDLGKAEVWNGSLWSGVGGGATGGGSDTVFVETSYTVTQDYTITAGKSAITVGDANGNVTIADGVSITIPDGSQWVIQGS